MDSENKKPSNTNPRESANIFSVIFMAFTFDIFKKRHSRELTMEDLWAPLDQHRSEHLGNLLEREWKKELVQRKLGKKPSVVRAVLKAFRKQFIYASLAAFLIETSIRLCQPILLGRMLRYFSSNTDVSQKEALVCATGFVALTATYVCFVAHYSLLVYNTAMEIRVAVCAIIYRKVVRLLFCTVSNSVAGEVNNLIANDLKILPYMAWFIQYLWLSPVLLIALSYAIWLQIGWPGVTGVAIVLVLATAIMCTGNLNYTYRKLNAKMSDERIQVIQEILLGVKFIKMYVWEKPFTSLVRLVRKAELKFTKKTASMRGIYLAFQLCNYRISCFCAMMLMATSGIPLMAEQIFTVAAYFASVSYLSSFLIRGFHECLETMASAKRIEKFLLQDDVAEAPNESKPIRCGEDVAGSAITTKNVTARWDKLRAEQTLSNVNVCVKKGSLVAVIGPVGSGKTSLLQAILGELQLQSGVVSVEGKMSYASQEPWLFGDTVRQNITFARPYQEDLYEKVVEVCALQRDFLLLPNGDLTLVGERGCSLSGGQKARINLARAVYNEADVYLLDDPLSAVDAHVAKHLFDECIMWFLKGKTRLLVTHQLQYLKHADHIIFLKNGKVEIQGPFSDFKEGDIDCAKYLGTQESALLSDEESKECTENGPEVIRVTEHSEDSAQRFAEKSFSGKLQKPVFMEYFLSGSNYIQLFCVVSVLLATQVTANTADFWMSYWTKQEEVNLEDRYKYISSVDDTNYTKHDFALSSPETRTIWEDWSSKTVFCISVYTGIIVALIVMALLRALVLFTICESCSNELHNQVINSIIRTNTTFFDINPSGRILNRLSNDVGMMDETLPRAMMDAAQNLLIAAGTFVLASAVNYWLILVVAVVAVIIYAMARVHLKTSTNLMRLEGISRSPVFVHLNATLQGLPTIRALKAEDVLKKEFDKHQDMHTSATYTINATARTFSFYVDCLCFIFISTVIYGFIFIQKDIYGGDVGLVVTQSYGIIMWLQFGVLQSVELIGNMTSVERVLEYKYLEQEDNWELAPGNVAPQGWPYKGRIQIQNTSLKYMDTGPSVLENINVTINPGEKIGIVGRTGAGKTSLILALFRLAKVEGSILIDSIDTRTISLQDLRRNISIIPQDPFLFSGTLRENLDRFNEFEDEELWRALECVEMKQMLHNSGGLNMKVSEKGANFSVGQKQLLCLARVILKKNKILVLDEATSNVDLATDELIQKTLREKFAECTVLTVAHRMNTIMDTDKVMVMSSGRLVEFDHPHLLLQNNEGTFYKMAKKTGQIEHLTEVALQSFNKLKKGR